MEIQWWDNNETSQVFSNYDISEVRRKMTVLVNEADGIVQWNHQVQHGRHEATPEYTAPCLCRL